MTEKTQRTSIWRKAWPGAVIGCILGLGVTLTGVRDWPWLQTLLAAIIIGGLLGIAIRLVLSASRTTK